MCAFKLCGAVTCLFAKPFLTLKKTTRFKYIVSNSSTGFYYMHHVKLCPQLPASITQLFKKFASFPH